MFDEVLERVLAFRDSDVRFMADLFDEPVIVIELGGHPDKEVALWELNHPFVREVDIDAVV